MLFRSRSNTYTYVEKENIGRVRGREVDDAEVRAERRSSENRAEAQLATERGT